MNPYYDSGGVTIYHGDALEVLPTLPGGVAHAVVTDPPYVIGAVSAGTLASKAGGWADMMNSAGWFAAWYRQAGRLCKRDGSFWTFLNWRSLPVVLRAASDARLPVTSVAVWDKQWIGPGGTQGLRPSYELIALLAQPDFAVPDRGVADVWQHKVGSYKPTGHPAEKPEGLVRRILTTAAVPAGGVVVDPFLGSGTTAVAAASLGLRCIAVEAEESWCEFAATRLAQGALFDRVAPPTGGGVGAVSVPPCPECARPFACQNCRRPLEWVDAVGSWLHGELPRYAGEPIGCAVPVPVHQRQGSRHPAEVAA